MRYIFTHPIAMFDKNTANIYIHLENIAKPLLTRVMLLFFFLNYCSVKFLRTIFNAKKIKINKRFPYTIAADLYVAKHCSRSVFSFFFLSINSKQLGQCVVISFAENCFHFSFFPFLFHNHIFKKFSFFFFLFISF